MGSRREQHSSFVTPDVRGFLDVGLVVLVEERVELLHRVEKRVVIRVVCDEDCVKGVRLTVHLRMAAVSLRALASSQFEGTRQR